MTLLQQNSPNSISGADIRTTEVDWSLKHFFALLVSGGVFSLLTSFCLARFNALPSSIWLLYTALSIAGLFSVIVFQALLVKSSFLGSIVALTEGLCLFVFLLSDISSWSVFGLALFIVSILIGVKEGKIHLSERMRIQFGRFSRIVLAWASTGFVLFISFFYASLYQQTNSISFDAFRFLTANGAPGVVRTFVPGFTPEMSTDEFFKTFAGFQFRSNPQLAQLSEADKQRVYAELGSQLQIKVSEVTQTPVDQNETILQYFYRIANRYISRFSADGAGVIPMLGVALFIYFTLKLLFFFYRYPIAWFCQLVIYNLLLATKVVYISTEPRNKEIILVK